MKRFPVLLLVLAGLLAACQTTATPSGNTVAQASALAQSWFDTPLTGTQLPLAPVDVISHHYSPKGISEIELSINGVALRSDPNPNANSTFLNLTQQWQPAGPGTYTLSVRARSIGGDWGNPASVIVTVGQPATPTFTPVPTDTPTPTLEATVTPTATATFTPTDTPTATATQRATLIPNPSVSFTADAVTLNPKDCTNLHWAINGQFSQALLDGKPVKANGSLQVCPPTTTTYTLRVVTVYNQNLDQTLTLTVNDSPFVTFTSDATTLNAGQCTNLHWTSGNIQSIFLNGQGVVGNDNRQVCPSATTTYTLLANTATGPINKQITITVNGAPAGAPVVNDGSVNTSIFYNVSGCGLTGVTVTTHVSNAGNVSLHWSIAGGPSGDKGMGNLDATTWQVTLNNTDVGDSTGDMTFIVSASNATGSAQSKLPPVVTYSNCKP